MAPRPPSKPSVWQAIAHSKPPQYQNVLFAFADHWNTCVGFRVSTDEYWECHSKDGNTKMTVQPRWWADAPVSPQRAKDLSIANDAVAITEA